MNVAGEFKSKNVPKPLKLPEFGEDELKRISEMFDMGYNQADPRKELLRALGENKVATLERVVFEQDPDMHEIFSSKDWGQCELLRGLIVKLDPRVNCFTRF